ncbi:MAG: hypothetical protein EOP48_32810 [Sphingobacteriales bacterium]|nr:MAG: hypothetical protein EOP48_32810 [Sphingobacteriales bacterium]
MLNLITICKKPYWLLAFTFCSASALAQTSYVECNFSANAGGLLEIGDYKLIRSAGAYDPAADSCNRSFSATRGVSYGDETAEGTVSLVNKLEIINDSYVFTSVATTSGSASLSLPPNYSSNVHGLSSAYSSIKIVSDGPVSYHFSASFVELSAHSPGQYQTDRLTFKTSLGSETVLGDLYPGDTYIGNEYQEEGYLTLGPDNLAIIEVKGRI